MGQKKLLVLGATGGTGQHLVAQALDMGHQVTAFVRSPDKITRHHERLRVVAGDVASGGPSLDHAMQGQHAVLSALGRGRSLKADRLIERSIPAIVAAMQAHKVRRLIFTSAIGVGETIMQTPFMLRLLQRMLLREIYADKFAGETILRRSGLEWTIVHPMLLNDGPLTRRYRSGERLTLKGMPKISRADVAHFLLSQLDDRTYINKVVLVAY
jgi:putative NADH-flavin reductase